MLSLASQQPLPPTSYNLPTSYSTAAMNMGLTSVNAGIDDLMEKDLLYNSLSMEPEPLSAPMAPMAGPSGRAVDMLEIPGIYLCTYLITYTITLESKREFNWKSKPSFVIYQTFHSRPKN